MQPDGPTEAVPAAATAEELGGWLSAMRSQPVPQDVVNPPPPRPDRRLVPALLFATSGAGLALLLGVAVWLALGPTAGVRGVVTDGSGAPRGGALVFVVSNPRLTAITDRSGGFSIRGVRLGRQKLVVVVAEIGQEFPIEVPGEGEIDVGRLTYVAPPER
jgi:hypothetical protein